MDWGLVKDVGVPLALVIFFVIQGKFREDRMATRLDEIQDYQRNKLEAVLTANTTVMAQLEKWLERHGVARAEIPGEPMAQWDRTRPRQTGDAT